MNAKNIDEYQAVSIFLNYQFFLAEKQIVLVLKLLIKETMPIAQYQDFLGKLEFKIHNQKIVIFQIEVTIFHT